MTRVKICGITNLKDARAAVAAGADALGFVFAPSPRQITSSAARDIAASVHGRVIIVGVFQNAPLVHVCRVADEVGLDCIQLHGDEPPEYCAALHCPVMKRLPIGEGDSHATLRDRIARYEAAAFLLDPGAGDGRTFHWDRALGLPSRIVIAGGLTPENVHEPVRLLRPFGVDVSTGVESSPGRKDAAKMHAFVHAVRETDANCHA